MALGVTLTYQDQVLFIVEAIEDDFDGANAMAIAAAACALSLAHSKDVVEVQADFKAAIAALKTSS